MNVQQRSFFTVLKLTDYVRTYSEQVGNDLCDAIIEAFHKSDSVYVDREERPTFHDLNISQRFLDKDPLWMGIQMTLQNVFANAINQYVEDVDCLYDFPQRYNFEQFRMKMYEPNGHDQFKEHVDVGDHSSAIRFLVAFLYLNDVEEGGETYFPKLKCAIKPKRGNILVFPPTWQYRHAGLPPVSSNKYIIGSYLHYTMQGMTETVLP